MQRFRISLIIILASVFCIGLFKNISYPLLWNDESETIMTAEKILQFGYPKVHDGKNIIYLPDEPTWIGYKKEIDANITIPWGSYYFATISAFLSNKTDDIYLKSALARIPFAAIGLLGLIIFALSVKDFFSDKSTYQKFILAFIAIEIFSVALFLHMREARYYSLVIFMTACFFYVFSNYFLHHKYSFKKYLMLMIPVLFITYQINIIAFATCCLTIAIYEMAGRIAIIFSNDNKKQKARLKELIIPTLKNLTPLFITALLIIPFIIFYDTFNTAARAKAHYVNMPGFLPQLDRIIFILKTMEFFYPVVFMKALQLIVWFRNKQMSNLKAYPQNNLLEKLTFFMSLFFIIFSLFAANMPFLFIRYFIVLQPIMTLILLVDLIIVSRYISSHVKKNLKLFARIAVAAIFIRLVFISLGEKINLQKNYIYQITHQLKGPLDYLIPYVKENFKNTEDLVLATNYEELSYIYYLGCKVTLGYMNKNLEEDLKYQPDIMIYRKKWGHNPEHYNNFIQKAAYNKVTFPVYDSPVNNIAEFYGNMEHQFKTKMATNEADKTEILIRVK